MNAMAYTSSIDKLISGIKSLDESTRLEATKACRKKLDRTKNANVEEMVSKGVVPYFIQFLSSTERYAIHFIIYIIL